LEADLRVAPGRASIAQDDVALAEPTERRDLALERHLPARAVLVDHQRRGTAGGGGPRCRALALLERRLDLQVALPEVVAHEELDLGGADETPPALAGGLQDQPLELRDQRRLDR